jgi:hypothetical protein
MKAERRHELQTNTLADWIGKHIEHVQPHSKTISIVIVVICVLGLSFLYVTGQQSASAGRSWTAFFGAFAGAIAKNDAEILSPVTTRYQGTEASYWSMQMMADIDLARGAIQLYRDREEAEELLKVARANYESVLANAKQGSLLQTRARFGLAQAYECLGDLDQAKRYYKLVANSAPDSAVAKEARHSLDRLSSEQATDWYTWFANQEPRLPPIAGNGGLPEIGPDQDTSLFPSGDDGLDLPSDLTDLPDRPDLSIPGADDSKSVENDGEPASSEESPRTTSESEVPNPPAPAQTSPGKVDDNGEE